MGLPRACVAIGLVPLGAVPFSPFGAVLILRLLACITGIPLEAGGPTTFMIALFNLFAILVALVLLGGLALGTGLVAWWMRTRREQRLASRRSELEARLRPGWFWPRRETATPWYVHYACCCMILQAAS